MTPNGLILVSVGTGSEVYRWTDPQDGTWIEIWIDNSGTFLFSDISGEPEMPLSVMQWLVGRTEYLMAPVEHPFFEEDEPVDKVAAAFERGQHELTHPGEVIPASPELVALGEQLQREVDSGQ